MRCKIVFFFTQHLCNETQRMTNGKETAFWDIFNSIPYGNSIVKSYSTPATLNRVSHLLSFMMFKQPLTSQTCQLSLAVPRVFGLEKDIIFLLTTSVTMLLVLLICVSASQWQVEGQRRLGEISVDLVGFSNLYVHEDATDPTEKYSLLLSTFNPIPFTSDTSYIFRHIGKYLDDLTSFTPTPLYDDFTFPREPSQTPGK